MKLAAIQNLRDEPDRDASLARYRSLSSRYDSTCVGIIAIRRAAIRALAVRGGETVFDVWPMRGASRVCCCTWSRSKRRRWLTALSDLSIQVLLRRLDLSIHLLTQSSLDEYSCELHSSTCASMFSPWGGARDALPFCHLRKCTGKRQHMPHARRQRPSESTLKQSGVSADFYNATSPMKSESFPKRSQAGRKRRQCRRSRSCRRLFDSSAMTQPQSRQHSRIACARTGNASACRSRKRRCEPALTNHPGEVGNRPD